MEDINIIVTFANELKIKRMKVFVSWSGGKDCTFSLYKFLQSSTDEVYCLLNMNRATTQNAHRVSGELLQAQADSLGINLVRETIEEGNDYIYHFDRVVNSLKEQGVECGVFGDIYLDTHRDWIEAQCERLGIKPIFPIWGMDVHDIYTQFVEAGFDAKVIAVRNDPKYMPMLRRSLGMELHREMLEHENFDVCGENGEYHSFVVDGPLFSNRVEYREVSEYSDSKIFSLDLDL